MADLAINKIEYLSTKVRNWGVCDQSASLRHEGLSHVAVGQTAAYDRTDVTSTVKAAL
jgi:hypothetical protein